MLCNMLPGVEPHQRWMKQKMPASDQKYVNISSENQAFRFSTEPGLKGKEPRYFVEGYLATYDRDSIGDIITESGMQDVLEQADMLTMDLEHEAFVPDSAGYGAFKSRSALIPVAKIVSKKLDDVGVYIKAEVNKNLSRFKEVWGSIKDGYIKGFSFAWDESNPADWVIDGDSRLLNTIRMFNATMTGSPINKSAALAKVAMKSRTALFSQGRTMKPALKAYNPDGKHVHTGEIPMGEHNHPEIEESISGIWNAIYTLQDSAMETKDEAPVGLKDNQNTEENNMTPEEEAKAKADAEAKVKEEAEVKAKAEAEAATPADQPPATIPAATPPAEPQTTESEAGLKAEISEMIDQKFDEFKATLPPADDSTPDKPEEQVGLKAEIAGMLDERFDALKSQYAEPALKGQVTSQKPAGAAEDEGLAQFIR